MEGSVWCWGHQAPPGRAPPGTHTPQIILARLAPMTLPKRRELSHLQVFKFAPLSEDRIHPSFRSHTGTAWAWPHRANSESEFTSRWWISPTPPDAAIDKGNSSLWPPHGSHRG